MSLWESGEIITEDKLNLKTVYIGSSPPPNPVNGMVWVDTSGAPYVVRVYRSGVWDAARGAPPDRVTAPPAADSDYSTPPLAYSATETPLLQLYGGATVLYQYGYTTRGGERVYSTYIGGKTVKTVAFYLKRVGSPSGAAYARVRRVDTDEVVAELGSFNVADLSTAGQWVTFTGSWPMPTGVDLRFLIEWSGGDTSNYLALLGANWDAAPWGCESWYSTQSGTYTDYSYDACMKILCADDPTQAIDEDAGSSWLAKQGDSWIAFDLGSTLAGVAGCRVCWPSDANYRPQAYKIQASVDGSNWDDVYEAASQPPAGWVEYSWVARNQTRYIRLLITQPGASGTRVCEFDYYQSSIWRHGHKGD